MTLNSRTTDVFVVGGGPAGLAAAIAARRRGFRVTVADPAIPPIDKACGEGLMPDGLAALNRLGIQVDGIDSHPFRGIRFVDSGVSVAADFPQGNALGVRRTVLHGLLVKQAAEAGVQLLWGTPVPGISGQKVLLANQSVPCRWIIGGDGTNSRVRRWAGLDSERRTKRRFGFRRHYQITPWSDFMELHWGPGCQVYVTPIGRAEICVALISRSPTLRLDTALGEFPELRERLANAAYTTTERGSLSVSRKLPGVCRGCVALIGDASGSVDAITGEGLCLAFAQALALARSLESGDFSSYEAEHRRLMKRPAIMANVLLGIGERGRLRRRALRALASEPGIFAKLLAMHVGALSPAEAAAGGLRFGIRMLTA
jgi:menaquinone-9 beta-reductase